MITGDKIYYTGDMANEPGILIITSIYKDKWGEWVDMKHIPEKGEEERPDIKSLPISHFEPGIGRRFWLLDEWNAKRKAEIEQILKQYGLKYSE